MTDITQTRSPLRKSTSDRPAAAPRPAGPPAPQTQSGARPPAEAPVDRFVPTGSSPAAPVTAGLYRPPSISAPAQQSGESLTDRLTGALSELGFDEREINDLLIVANMLAKVSPEAAERLVDGLESLAEGHSSGGVAPVASGGDAGAAGQAQFSLEYVSLELSITEVSASVESDGEGGEVVQASSRQVEVRFERLQISMNQQMQQADPMVLDIDGDGFDLRPTSDGVLFDLTGDGAGEGVLTAFVSDDDALLFLDANENGLLDGGSELVGNRVEGKNGFEELSDLDDNGDDRIDSADEAWKTLRLFQDKDGNGKVGKGEVALLEDLGIAELSTRWTRNERTDEEGVIRIGDGGFERITGVQGEMRDYMFGFLEV